MLNLIPALVVLLMHGQATPDVSPLGGSDRAHRMHASGLSERREDSAANLQAGSVKNRSVTALWRMALMAALVQPDEEVRYASTQPKVGSTAQFPLGYRQLPEGFAPSGRTRDGPAFF